MPVRSSDKGGGGQHYNHLRSSWKCRWVGCIRIASEMRLNNAMFNWYRQDKERLDLQSTNTAHRTPSVLYLYCSSIGVIKMFNYSSNVTETVGYNYGHGNSERFWFLLLFSWRYINVEFEWECNLYDLLSLSDPAYQRSGISTGFTLQDDASTRRGLDYVCGFRRILEEQRPM